MTRDAEHTPTGYEDAASVVVNQAPAPSSLSGGEVDPLVQRLAYGYAIMHTTICHMAGTSGASGRWYYDKANEAFGRVSPIHSITEESNPHVNGDYFSGLSNFLAALSPEAPALNAIGCAELEVGRAVYERIEKLIDATTGPEAEELSYLAHLAASVEEVGGYDGPEAPAREGVESFETVEARAEAWSDRAEIQRMVETTTGVFAKWSSPEILSRFRQQFMAVIQQAFIEGYDAALTPRHEAPASPAWRDEYNRVEAIREAAEGQDRVARSTADPIAKSDAETQAAGHWTRYEREVAKLNAASGHEAPAKGAGELKNLHRLASQEADHLEREAEEADDNNWQDWAVTMRQGADYIRQLIRARSSAPEAREDGYRRVDLGMVAITIETMHRRIEELTGSRQSQYDGAVSLARDLYLTAAPSADKLRIAVEALEGARQIAGRLDSRDAGMVEDEIQAIDQALDALKAEG